MLTTFIHTKSVVDGPLDAQVIPCPSLICFNNGIHDSGLQLLESTVT
jgi:hypothetical protein